jgi:sodium/bile acid cotransporter 7
VLKRLPVDTFLLALLAVVALAALFPASGTIGDVLSVATKIAIALLFFLYGARLSPTEALHGLRHWQLHLLVLAATFVAFPLLGLAARGLVPSVLTPDLYTGVLFLCLVPSTVQSSIAFTSIAHGNVPAAIVSASLSNILGVVLTPLLVVLLMHTTGARRIDGSAVLDIVVQLLLPFIAGQLLRPWLAPWVHRHALVTKAFDPARRLHRFLDEHHRTRLEHGEPVAGGGGRGGVHGAAGGHARRHCGHDSPR